jgi:IMP dehydrogenase
MWIGRNRKARVTYGFDEIALVPGNVTINPNEVDITWRVGRYDAEPLKFKIPILASAMDGVVDVKFAIAMGKLGGLAVLNLEGVQTRYKNPQEVLQKIVEADKADVTALLQKSHRRLARTFLSCKAPSRPCVTFPPNINRSISRNFAGKCASR